MLRLGENLANSLLDSHRHLHRRLIDRNNYRYFCRYDGRPIVVVCLSWTIKQLMDLCKYENVCAFA